MIRSHYTSYPWGDNIVNVSVLCGWFLWWLYFLQIHQTVYVFFSLCIFSIIYVFFSLNIGIHIALKPRFLLYCIINISPGSTFWYFLAGTTETLGWLKSPPPICKNYFNCKSYITYTSSILIRYQMFISSSFHLILGHIKQGRGI